MPTPNSNPSAARDAGRQNATGGEWAQFTPGPWQIETWQYGGHRGVPTIIAGSRDAVAQVLDLWCISDRTAEREANARLITQAPDMLAALKELLGAIEAGTNEVEPDVFDAHILTAERVIAQAEGRG